MPHVIRLRGPWESQPLPNGTTRFTRRFHRPTGLDASSRVWLVIENFADGAVVTVNDRMCSAGADGHPGAVHFDITSSLQPQNLIAIDVASPTMGDVRLEIE